MNPIPSMNVLPLMLVHGAHTEREFGVLSSLPERAKALALFLHAWPERIDGILAGD